MARSNSDRVISHITHIFKSLPTVEDKKEYLKELKDITEYLLQAIEDLEDEQC